MSDDYQNPMEPDDEVTRLLRQGLKDEADAVPIPNRLRELRTSARGGLRVGRRWLVAGAAAAVLVLLIGVGVRVLGTDRGPSVGNPAPSASASRTGSEASAPARTTAPQVTPTPVTRTVSGAKIGFASPSGNIVCVMGGDRSPDGVECHLVSEPVWASSFTNCPTVGAPGEVTAWSAAAGSVLLTSKGPDTWCNSQGFTEFGPGSPYTSWKTPADQSVGVPGGTAPVLGYGMAARVGDTICVMDSAGLTCSRADGSAFRVSNEHLTLRRADGTQTVATSTAAFATPTGNVVCYVDGRTGVVCVVINPTYSPPPRPADCHFDWPARAVLTDHGSFVCASDSMADQASLEGAGPSAIQSWWDASQPTAQVPSGLQAVVAKYGTTFVAGAYTCLVSQKNVSCKNSKTGGGLEVSREAYRFG